MKYLWFMAANLRGEWIITQGEAFIEINEDGDFTASLKIVTDLAEPFINIGGIIDNEGLISAEAHFCNSDMSRQALDLTGTYLESIIDDRRVETFTFTDWGTMIGIAGCEDDVVYKFSKPFL